MKYPHERYVSTATNTAFRLQRDRDRDRETERDTDRDRDEDRETERDELYSNVNREDEPSRPRPARKCFNLITT